MYLEYNTRDQIPSESFVYINGPSCYYASFYTHKLFFRDSLKKNSTNVIIILIL